MVIEEEVELARVAAIIQPKINTIGHLFIAQQLGTASADESADSCTDGRRIRVVPPAAGGGLSFRKPYCLGW